MRTSKLLGLLVRLSSKKNAGVLPLLRHSTICCHLSACSDLSALKCPTRQIQILMGSRMLLGVGGNAIGGVDLDAIDKNCKR